MKRFIVPLFTSIVLLGTSMALAERGLAVKEKKDAKTVTATTFRTTYYALVIGNNEYRQLPKLKTAVNDAKEISRILSEKYGFKTKLLQNATRRDILNAINEYRKNLGEKDSFLIYYAGHGEYDRTAEKGYWLPVDAQLDNPTDWIMAEDITSSIKRISARHVLVVADSCYSGTLTRSAGIDLNNKKQRDEYLRKMMERPSRTLMASGGNEPVADSGGGSNHSVFASAFLTALKEAESTTFTAEDLFHGRVKAIVAGRSEQVPQYSDLRNSGHEGGDFIFQIAQTGGAVEETDTTASDTRASETPGAKATSLAGGGEEGKDRETGYPQGSGNAHGLYQKMDFGFNKCNVEFGELKRGVSETDMKRLATDAGAEGFTYQPMLKFGKLIIGAYPTGCKSPSNLSWPLYLKIHGDEQSTVDQASSKPFSVTHVSLKARQYKFVGDCPVTIEFGGGITTNGPGTVQYAFMRSDGTTSPVNSLSFEQAGMKQITATWTLVRSYEGWQAIKVLSPNQIESLHEPGKAGAFSVVCESTNAAGKTKKKKVRSKEELQ